MPAKLRALCAVIALGLCVAVPTSVVAAHVATPELKIMEMGDSITAGAVSAGGFEASGGYRRPLALMLEAHHMRFSVVGSRADFSGNFRYPRHEGWPGYVIRSYPSGNAAGQLYGRTATRAIRGFAPNLILLMIGTNDLVRLERHDAGYTQRNILANFDLLVGQLYTLDPSAQLIIAGVVDSPKIENCAIEEFDTGLVGCGSSHGAGIPSVVAKYRRLGYQISYAFGMDHAVPRDLKHFPDGLHPFGQDSYASMAAVWFKAIEVARKRDPNKN